MNRALLVTDKYRVASRRDCRIVERFIGEGTKIVDAIRNWPRNEGGAHRRCGAVYLITCLPSGDTYVGVTGKLRERLQVHISAMRSPNPQIPAMAELYQRYGVDAFTVRILKRIVYRTYRYHFDVCLEDEKAAIAQLRPTLNLRIVNPASGNYYPRPDAVPPADKPKRKGRAK